MLKLRGNSMLDSVRGISENTKRAYLSDMKKFVEWSKALGLSSLPANPRVVSDFLLYELDRGSIGKVTHIV